MKVVLANNVYLSALETIKEIEAEKNDLCSKHVILVPDRFSFIAEKLVFSALNISSTLNISVMGLNRFAKTVFKNAKKTVRSLSQPQFDILVRRAALNKKDEFEYFRQDAISVGFSQKIRDTIVLFKTSRISPAEVRSLSDLEPLKSKLHDISIVFEEYEKLKGDDFFDTSDILDLAENNVYDSDFVKNSKFYFVGFDSLTRQGFSLLNSIIKNSQKVVFGLCFPESDQRNKHIYDLELFEEIRLLSKKENFPLEIREVKRDEDIHNFVTKNLFMKPLTRRENNGFFSVFQRANENEEVLEVVKEIERKVKTEGYRFRDFSIALPFFDSYKLLFQRLFQERNIPYYYDDDEKFSLLPLPRFVLQLLKASEKDFPQNEFYSVLFSPFVRISEDEKLIFFDFVQRTGLDKLEIFENQKIDFENKIVIDEIQKRLAFLFSDFISISKKRLSVGELISIINKLFDKLEIDATVCEVSDFFRDQNKLKEKSINDQVVQKFHEFLGEFDAIETSDLISVSDFSMLLESGLESLKLSSVPLSLDAVFLGDATDSFFTPVRKLFVVGATSDSLPKTIYDCGVISDGDLGRIQQNIKIGPTIEKINFRSRLKLLSLFSSDQKSFSVSYPILSGDQKQKFPATFVSLLSSAFEDSRAEEFCDVVSTFDAKRELSFLLSALLPSDAERINNLYFALKEAGEDVSSFQNFFSITKNSFVSDNLLKNRKTISASEIEKFFSCPYSHFLAYSLSLKEKEQSAFGKKEIGSLFHRALEKLLKKHSTDICNLNFQNLEICARDLFGESMNEFDGETKIYFLKNAGLLRALENEFVEIAKKVQKEQLASAFHVIENGLEKKFYGPVEIGTDDFKLKFAGAIDRVDMFGDNVRIIDYKSGKDSLSLRDVFYGIKIQPFLYAKAIVAILKKPVVGAFLFSIKGKLEKSSSSSPLLSGFFLKDSHILKALDKNVENGYKSGIVRASLNQDGSLSKKGTSGLDADDFQHLIDYSLRLANHCVSELSKGFMEASPLIVDSLSPCAFCKAKNFCAFDQSHGFVERKAESVLIEQFPQKEKV